MENVEQLLQLVSWDNPSILLQRRGQDSKKEIQAIVNFAN